MLALIHKYESCILIDTFLTDIALGYNTLAQKPILYDTEMSKHTEDTSVRHFSFIPWALFNSNLSRKCMRYFS